MRSESFSQLKSILIVACCLSMFAALGTAPQNSFGQDTKKPAPKKKPVRRPVVKKKTGPLKNVNISFVTGTNLRDLDGDRPGQFQDGRDFPYGVSIRAMQVGFNSPERHTTYNFRALELSEKDRRVEFDMAKAGKFRTRVLWDALPRYFSDGRTFHNFNGRDNLVVDPSIRAQFQNAPNSSAAASQVGTALPAIVTQNLANTRPVTLRMLWDQLRFTQSYYPNKDLELYFRAQVVNREGLRPRTTGTFANETNGPNNDLVWEALGMELPEPVDQSTINLTAGFQYSKRNWRFGVQYDLSMFRNAFRSLTWENPFRTTDALATSPAFNVGRNRFARAQLAMAPDNTYQSISVFGSVDLPKDTQLRGSVTWGRSTQDEQFLPYTLNSAMVAANLLPGQPPLFNLDPPQDSLDGEVNTLNQDYVLASRPWKTTRFVLRYRYVDRDNDTPVIFFPGLPAFGDSGVRTPVDFYNLPIENFPSSYTKQNATATWDWSPIKKLDWELEYEFEAWNRTFREAPRTNEHSIRGQLDIRPKLGIGIQLDYRYAHREPTMYLTQPLVFSPTTNPPFGAWIVLPGTVFRDGLREEFNLLRRYDENERIRKEGGATLQVTRWDNVGISASYRFRRDDYDKTFYGLLYDESSMVDAELSFFPKGVPDETAVARTGGGWVENSFFYVNYSREFTQTGYAGLGHRTIGAARNVTACCAQFPIANTFLRASKINFDMLQVGFNTAGKFERTVIDFTYGLGFARDRTTTANPFPILSVSLRTAGAYDYPDVLTRQQEATLSITRQIKPDIAVGAVYRYQPYTLDDYYTNSLAPYQARQPAAEVGNSFSPRYLFLDARFTTYHANVVTFFVRYTF
jgi:MtrB/PioB family decaheme-associated outer membrane protein